MSTGMLSQQQTLHFSTVEKERKFSRFEAAYMLYQTFRCKDELLLCEQNICSLELLKFYWNTDIRRGRHLNPILD